MFEQNLIVVSVFLGILLIVWAIVKFAVAKSSAVGGSTQINSDLSLRGKITLEPGVNVYLVASENSEIIITVNNRKFGSAQAEVLHGCSDLSLGGLNA
jgi:hypothetical protein